MTESHFTPLRVSDCDQFQAKQNRRSCQNLGETDECRIKGVSAELAKVRKLLLGWSEKLTTRLEAKNSATTPNYSSFGKSHDKEN